MACSYHGFPGILLEVSRDGRITEANDVFERIVDEPSCELSLAKFIDESSRNKIARILANPQRASQQTWELLILARGEIRNHTFAVVLRDGAENILLIELPRDTRVEALTDQLVSANSDLVSTQRQLARENRELDRLNLALDEFAHVVSHDLKAPLRAIGTFTEWIEREVANTLSEESREHFALLRNRVALMNRLIDGILRSARAGREVAERETVNVRELLEDVVSLLAPLPSVTVNIGPMPTLNTERALLQQVFMNLLSNALKHGGRDDLAVEISAVRLRSTWQFCVRDNGAGIPERMQQRVWQLFQTATQRNGIDATGIGLSVTRNIVERRGGRAWLESTPGQGAAFYFEWNDE